MMEKEDKLVVHLMNVLHNKIMPRMICLFFALLGALRAAERGQGQGQRNYLQLRDGELPQWYNVTVQQDKGRECLERAFSGYDCGKMTLQEKLRLTIKLLNCYGDEMGLKPYRCADSWDISVCMKKLNDEEKSSIRDKSLTIDSVCYSFKNETVMQRISMLVDRVVAGSEETLEQLYSLVETSQSVFEATKESVEMQAQLAVQQEGMKAEMKGIEEEHQKQRELIQKGFGEIGDATEGIKEKISESVRETKELGAVQREVCEEQRRWAAGMKEQLSGVAESAGEVAEWMKAAAAGQAKMEAAAAAIGAGIGAVGQMQREAEEALGRIGREQEGMKGVQAETREEQKRMRAEMEMSFDSIAHQHRSLQRQMEESVEHSEQILEQQRRAVAEMEGVMAVQGKAFEETVRQLVDIRSDTTMVTERLRQQNEYLRTEFSSVRVWMQRILSGQSSIFADLSGLHSIAFYVACLLFFQLVTSLPHTKEARIWIFYLWVVFFVGERGILWVVGRSGAAAEEMRRFAGSWHMLFVCLCVCAVGHAVWTYKDYEALNNTLLKENWKKARELTNAFRFYADEVSRLKRQEEDGQRRGNGQCGGKRRKKGEKEGSVWIGRSFDSFGFPSAKEKRTTFDEHTSSSSSSSSSSSPSPSPPLPPHPYLHFYPLRSSSHFSQFDEDSFAFERNTRRAASV
ncbi:putative Gamete expressed 1 - GEX1, incomplete [Monocercomonoides exilis]|uniref:uncharacterized protein n=1 Tax=Monocercomonoides exilis TaxID=2049356 RepID=UPI003559C83F|nr:hypothetical protein MONOS_16849 [Monocercomonoides exilis]KAH7829120.1 putative Gamete expressed 1 - GEX1, incomplete [Monocercomonoides exilis]